MTDLLRHIRACNNAGPMAGRLPFLVDGNSVGYLDPGLARRLGSNDLPSDGLADTTRRLADEGLFRWREEAFDVRAAWDGPVLARMDRGALPAFGVQAIGVHLNGLVQRGGETLMWVARRAQHKLLDPGKLDHLVGGGVSAGMTPLETLAKEADEEAAIPAALIATATEVSVIAYAMDRDEGLRRDRLHCYDLLLPGDFVPQARDGEVESFELWPVAQVLDTVRRTDAFKFNVNLVLIDFFLRHGVVQGAEAAELRAALNPDAAGSGPPGRC